VATTRHAGCHRAWLAKPDLAAPGAQLTLSEYVGAIDALETRRETLERAIGQLIGDSPWAQDIALLRWLRGIDTLSPIGLAVEVGDFRRFEHPRLLMGYLGLVPLPAQLQREPPPGAHHKVRFSTRPQAAGRSGVALPPPAPARHDAAASGLRAGLGARPPHNDASDHPQPELLCDLRQDAASSRSARWTTPTTPTGSPAANPNNDRRPHTAIVVLRPCAGFRWRPCRRATPHADSPQRRKQAAGTPSLADNTPHATRLRTRQDQSGPTRESIRGLTMSNRPRATLGLRERALTTKHAPAVRLTARRAPVRPAVPSAEPPMAVTPKSQPPALTLAPPYELDGVDCGVDGDEGLGEALRKLPRRNENGARE
jgi:hypothetical protein